MNLILFMLLHSDCYDYFIMAFHEQINVFRKIFKNRWKLKNVVYIFTRTILPWWKSVHKSLFKWDFHSVWIFFLRISWNLYIFCSNNYECWSTANVTKYHICFSIIFFESKMIFYIFNYFLWPAITCTTQYDHIFINSLRVM